MDTMRIDGETLEKRFSQFPSHSNVNTSMELNLPDHTFGDKKRVSFVTDLKSSTINEGQQKSLLF
jgi:hypothetical protein